MDCAGNCFGDAQLDDCGICQGENLSCLDEIFSSLPYNLHALIEENHILISWNFDIEIEKRKEFTFNLPSTHNSLIYLIDGEVKVGEQNHNPIKDSTLIILTRGEKLKVSGLTKAKFLLISGKPIGEPIARGGPFVMNTKEEILKAVQDYHNGTFVT